MCTYQAKHLRFTNPNSFIFPLFLMHLRCGDDATWRAWIKRPMIQGQTWGEHPFKIYMLF